MGHLNKRVLGLLGFGLVAGGFRKGVRKQGFALNWMLLVSSGNSMIGYLIESQLE